MDRLARDFTAHDCDIRHTLRLIVTSAAFARSQLSNQHNQSDDRYYSRAIERPLEAEVLADAIVDVTGVPNRFGGQPQGTRAVDLFDSRIQSTALDILGRCSRVESCETRDSSRGGISKMLHLINGELLNAKVIAEKGELHPVSSSPFPWS